MRNKTFGRCNHLLKSIYGDLTKEQGPKLWGYSNETNQQRTEQNVCCQSCIYISFHYNLVGGSRDNNIVSKLYGM